MGQIRNPYDSSNLIIIIHGILKEHLQEIIPIKIHYKKS